MHEAPLPPGFANLDFPAQPLEAEDGNAPNVPSDADFVTLDPPGGLIGKSQWHGQILADDQQDLVSFEVEDGQTITVVVEPAGELRSFVQLADTTLAPLATASANADGEPVILQTIPITKAGEHSVVVEGVAESQGDYTVSIFLNAAVEEEGFFVSMANNSPSNAQDLDNAFLALSPASSARAAVVGRRGADLLEDFETGTLNEEWSTFSTGTGRARASDVVRPASGRYALVLDQAKAGSVTRKEATWTVDLSGVSDAALSFFHADFNDDENPLPDSFTGSVSGDGVAISEDGNQWFTVLNATDVPFGEWTWVQLDLVAAANSAGIGLDDEFFIKFQQVGNGLIPNEGRAFDQIQIETIPNLILEDWYRFTLNDGQTISAVLDSLAPSRGVLELFDHQQALVATSSRPTNADQMIHNFTDATTNGLPDDYWIRVLDPADEYVLILARDATFDQEPNSSVLLTQDLADSTQAWGFVSDRSGPSLQLIQSFSGPEFTGFVPPDPILAAGPEQLVALINTTVSIYDKSSGIELFTQDLSRPAGFFGDVGSVSNVFDPWVVYDADSQRFFIVAIEIANDFEAYVYLAVSTSATPTGGTDWHKYRLDFTHDPEPMGLGVGLHFPDYEKLGISSDAIFLSGNYFAIDAGAGVYAGITAFEKSSLLNGGPARVVYEEFFDGFSVFPLNHFDSGSTQYFAEAIGSDQIRLHAVVDALTNPTRHSFDLTVDSYEPPVDVPQLGDGAPADPVGERIMTGVWRHGSAWFAHSVVDPAIGDGENVARWYEVATHGFPAADPALIQAGNVDPGPNVHAWVPALAVDGAGNMGIGFAVGGPDQYFGAGFTGRLATDPPGHTALPITELVAGESEYELFSGARNRWGDYTGMAIDPADDATFWAMNEYANAAGVWDTRIGAFQIDDVPDSDYYSVFANSGDSLLIQTHTPLSGGLALINDLDPDLELYGPDGSLLVQDTNSGTNKNGLIAYAVSEAGEYRVRVLTGGGQGTYVLEVDGATGDDPSPRVLGSAPDDGQMVGTFPDVIRIDMSEPILVTSVGAADLTVNGSPALSVDVRGRTLEFVIDPAASIGDGSYTVELSANLMDYQGHQIATQFSTRFEVDTTGPSINATRWNGSALGGDLTIPPGPLTFEADFSEDLFLLASARRGLRSPGIDDVVLVDKINDRIVEEDDIRYDPQAHRFSVDYGWIPEGEYRLILKSGKGAFEDHAGNALDGEALGPEFDGSPTGDGVPGGDYLIDFRVDVTEGDPRPFRSVNPVGSLVLRSDSTPGYLHDVIDQDVFRFFAHQGETISVVAKIDSDVHATLEIDGQVALIAPTSNAAPGDDIRVSPVTIPADGFYQVGIAASGATFYDLDLVRNAVNEFSVGDSDESNPVAATASTFDFLAGHYGIVGHSQRFLTFEHFNDPAQFVDISATGTATGLLDDDELLIESTIDNKIVPRGEVTIANNGGIAAGPENIFFQNLPLPAPDIGRAVFPYWDDLDDLSGDVYYEERLLDGVPTLIVQWQRPHFDIPDNEVIFQLQLPEGGRRLARFAYQDVDFGDPDYDAGGSATIGYQESEQVGFQFSFGLLERNPNFRPDVRVANGDVVDLIEAPDVDVYTLDLSGQVGHHIDIVLAGQGGVDFSGEVLELLDSNDQVIATASANPMGVSASNFDLGILNLLVPDIGNNVYRLRLSSVTVGDYGIVVTDLVIAEAEPNDTSSDPLRELTSRRVSSLGHLDATNGIDRYQLQVTQGETVQARLFGLLDHPSAQPLNDLDPAVTVLASDNTTILASDLDSLDGRGAMVSFVAPTSEIITIETSRTSGAGTYLLTTSTAPTAQLTIDNVARGEGDGGTTDFTFTVTRDHNEGQVTVQFDTHDVSATSGTDYHPVSKNLLFLPGGAMSQTVTVSVVGDFDDEGYERFLVELTQPVGAEIQNSVAIGSIANDDGPPRVRAVRLGSSHWQTLFINELDPIDRQGFEIAAGTDQLRTAPWSNIDQIYIAFSQDVGSSFTPTSVSLNGVLVTDYTTKIIETTFDSKTLTGVIHLTEPIGRDKLVLSISDSVADRLGRPLDGEWNDSQTQGESGDGTAGGEFRFRFNVLPGDVDQDGGFPGGGIGGFDLNRLVNAFDPVGGSSYSPFANLDGDGDIGGIDLEILVNNFLTSLPTAEPVSAFAAFAVADARSSQNDLVKPLEAIDAALRVWSDEELPSLPSLGLAKTRGTAKGGVPVV